MNKVIELQEEFKKEAMNAPTLFRDLAKVEQYIAESYKTRSFIELIQNADDAQARNFGIHVYDNYVIVGNDGRDFTNEDIKAICRSGSSNKIRGGSTIGYRGIGFKSVSNLAKRIYVISGKSRFLFDKELTKKLLNISDDVPLIRIPHNVDNTIYDEQIEKLKIEYGYTTFFVFENIKEDVIENEFQQFDKSSILFLNYIVTINLINKIKIKKIKKEMNLKLYKIMENKDFEEWMIISSNNKYDKLAFKVKNNSIISADILESVIHSFTPTTEVTGGYFKINGNFSTDPSRKQIDFDDISEQSFQNCVKLMCNTIREIINGNQEYIGFFKPFIEFNNMSSSNKIRTKLLSYIKENLLRDEFYVRLRLKPEKISMEDYKKICENQYTYIPEEIIMNYPEINRFFELIDIKYLSTNEMIEAIKRKCDISEVGLATILGKIINKYRYDFSNKIVDEISKTQIFITSDGITDISKIKSYWQLNEKYRQVLNDNCDVNDIKFVLNKLGIEFERKYEKKEECDLGETKRENEDYFQNSKKISLFSNILSKKEKNVYNDERMKSFRQNRTPNIKKWRSAEVNLVEYLECFENVDKVKDVSISNLGYDIDMMLKSGKRLYIEVKSLLSFSQSFKITNNEYTCAHNYGDEYYIALVINTDDFQVKFVQNPIENLHFEKKCEQWSWLCSDYKIKMLDITEINGG